MANGAKNWLRGRRVVLLTSEIWISKIRASLKSIYMICQSQPLSIGGSRHFVGSPLQKKGGAKKGRSAKDGSAKDGSAKDGSAKDGSAKDGSAKDGSAKDGSAKDGSTTHTDHTTRPQPDPSPTPNRP